MKKRINKTRTILLLLADREMNLTFSSKKHQLKINSINPRDLTNKFIGGLTISFTNPIDTNSSINNNNSSVNLLILRKSKTNSLISKAKHEKSMIFTRKVSVSRMKLEFNFQPQKEEDFIIESNRYKKYEADYLRSFHYLINLAYSLLPKVDSLEANDNKSRDDIEGGFNSEKDNSDIEEDRKEEISLLEKEIKPYLYNEDYDDLRAIKIK